jgi:predicted signal transduction protein with EAL and GGDEF domain
MIDRNNPRLRIRLIAAAFGAIVLLEPRAVALAESIAQPFRVSDVSGTIGVNVGGALFPRDGHNEDDLLLAANLAMYRAKRSNRAFWIEPRAEAKG